MRSAFYQSAFRQSWLFVAGLLLLLLAIALRWDQYPRSYFADELIPQAVIKYMDASGTLDTNWEHADWRGDYAGAFYQLKQYNFSSYHTVLYGFQQVLNAQWQDSTPPLVIYRCFSLLCQMLTLWLIYLLTRRLFGAHAAIWASVFFAVVPQAVIDAHYARPESFVMLLVALACWLSVKQCTEMHSKEMRSRGMSWLLMALSASVWGVAFACKFSFIPMAGLAFASSCYLWRRWWVPVLWLVSFIAGIGLTAPYILKDLPGFFHGIGLLLAQYSTPSPVNTVDGGNRLLTVVQMSSYLAVFFSVPVLIIVTASLLKVEDRSKVFLWLAAGISVFYLMIFAVQSVFFERNLSHLLPLWAVMFGVGCETLLRAMHSAWALRVMRGILMVSVAWLLFLSVSIDRYFFVGLLDVKAEIARQEVALREQMGVSRIVHLNAMNGLEVVTRSDASVILRLALPKEPATVLVQQAMEQAGFQQVAYRELPLAFLPYSQLQINQLPPAYAYYRKQLVSRQLVNESANSP